MTGAGPAPPGAGDSPGAPAAAPAEPPAPEGAAPKTLVVILGPPAVGKTTVGEALRDLTGLPLFHNHLSLEAVLPVFEFGSEPFRRLVGGFRERVFEEVVASDLPGLIFTYVWAFDAPGDERFIRRMKAIFEDRGGRTVFVELRADLETRLARNRTQRRLELKPSKRDVEASTARLLDNDARYRLNSAGDFPFGEHLIVDNTALGPAQVAERVARRFALRRVARSASP